MNGVGTEDGAVDFYRVLGISTQATQEEVKRAYHRKALQSHPDKKLAGGGRDAGLVVDRFHHVAKAWEVLSDPVKRATYDATLQARLVGESPVSAEVDLDEMEFREEDGSYRWPCRCGRAFVITESQLEEGVDVVLCGGCSFAIRVHYTLAPLSEDDEDENDS
ncbi:DnaJ subfamily C member 21 [Balamuthia mandrillaris]